MPEAIVDFGRGSVNLLASDTTMLDEVTGTPATAFHESVGFTDTFGAAFAGIESVIDDAAVGTVKVQIELHVGRRRFDGPTLQ